MEAFWLKTTRYSVVLRRLIERYAPCAEFLIDRRRYTEQDLPWLLDHWCTNRNIRATHDFEIRRDGEAIAGFHDGPSELWVAASERPLVDQLISEKLARRRCAAVARSDNQIFQRTVWRRVLTWFAELLGRRPGR